MKILVTGGAGFIGSHLCERLLEGGDEVICIDNLFTSRRENIAHLLGHRHFEFMRHDVCAPWHVECDRIYHLACPASPVHYQRNPVRTIETAVLGTRNALECARSTRARLLITSTSEVYGDPEEHPQKESYVGKVNMLGPRACYDEGKRVGESLATSWAAQFGTDVRIARLFNTYGPRMASEDGRLIPNFILQAMRKEPLTVYGDVSQTRSFCYVSDTVDGIMKFMEMRREEEEIVGIDVRGPVSSRRPEESRANREVPVINIGNPDERTIASVARDVIAAFGGAGTVEKKSLPADDPRQRCPDITRAKDMLGWQPEVPYAEGIAKTIEWYRDKVRSESESGFGASSHSPSLLSPPSLSTSSLPPPSPLPLSPSPPSPARTPAQQDTKLKKLAFLLEPWVDVVRIDPTAIFTDPRGLTGSEMTCVMQAIEMSKRGYDVTMYSYFTSDAEVMGVKFARWDRWATEAGKEWYAAFATIYPRGLQYLGPGTLRIFNQQVNDFSYCGGWEPYTDVVTALSGSHKHHLTKFTNFQNWRILPNGCDPSAFHDGAKKNHKLVFASSADRGLHWLLELFPRLRKRVPDAELHIYYTFRDRGEELYASIGEHEMANRFKYMKMALAKLKDHGVFHHRSVSRREIADVFSEGRILAYTCDPVRFTEGFSCTTLEAAVAGCLPVICGEDALGELYGAFVPTVPPPYAEHRSEYFDLLVRYLTDDAAYDSARARAKKLGEMYNWSAVGERLRFILEDRES